MTSLAILSTLSHAVALNLATHDGFFRDAGPPLAGLSRITRWLDKRLLGHAVMGSPMTP